MRFVGGSHFYAFFSAYIFGLEVVIGDGDYVLEAGLGILSLNRLYLPRQFVLLLAYELENVRN